MSSSPVSQNKLAYHIIRVALALLYLYFGVLKYFEGCSPVEELAGQTIHVISFQSISPRVALLGLAVFESLLGVLLLVDRFRKVALVLFLGHMAGTFLPLVVLPSMVFNGSPFVPTLAGQYIWKNVVFVAAVSTVFVPVAFEKKQQI